MGLPLCLSHRGELIKLFQVLWSNYRLLFIGRSVQKIQMFYDSKIQARIYLA